MSVVLFYALCWFGLMVIAILNGALRVSTYGKHMPEIRAHQLSCLTGIVLIGLSVWVINIFWPINTEPEAIQIGLIWLVMTIIFEFVFGHYVMKHSWKKLLHDYRIDKGRLWGIVLLWVFFVPLIIFMVCQ